MAEDPPDKRTWSDSQLIATVAVSHSWRGVMRELGLCATSAGAIRFVKRHVILLGLDTSHFTGQRRWSDAQLKRSVADAYSWRELLSELGLSGSAAERTRVKAHATRLGLDLSRMQPPGGDRGAPRPEARNQPAAAGGLRPAGLHAPPCLDGIKRIQVKTTTYKKDGWQVQMGRRPYSVGNRGLLGVPGDPDA